MPHTPAGKSRPELLESCLVQQSLKARACMTDFHYMCDRTVHARRLMQQVDDNALVYFCRNKALTYLCITRGNAPIKLKTSLYIYIYIMPVM